MSRCTVLWTWVSVGAVDELMLDTSRGCAYAAVHFSVAAAVVPTRGRWRVRGARQGLGAAAVLCSVLCEHCGIAVPGHTTVCATVGGVDSPCWPESEVRPRCGLPISVV
jgi:hypothetical protein